VKSATGRNPSARTAPFIEAGELRKVFKRGTAHVEALKGVNLTVERGDMVAVVGASGAGKSTLLHILGTLDRPTGGEVRYDGVDVFSTSNGALAEFRNRTIGFVFQAHHLLPEFSALENTMMPALIQGQVCRKARERAENILTEVGLQDRMLHKPGELSGGEQQRVAVARALILEPAVVLADEPTGNLDSVTGEAVVQLLWRLNDEKRVTMVVVTHNEGLPRRIPRSYQPIDGRAV